MNVESPLRRLVSAAGAALAIAVVLGANTHVQAQAGPATIRACIGGGGSLRLVGPSELGWMRSADCVLADGTFWCDDEMTGAGLSRKTAREMGHLPQRDHLVDGKPQRGMMTVLAGLPARHKLLVHINNTNPVLDEGSPERRELERHGIGVAHDGMEIVL